MAGVVAVAFHLGVGEGAAEFQVLLLRVADMLAAETLGKGILPLDLFCLGDIMLLRVTDKGRVKTAGDIPRLIHHRRTLRHGPYVETEVRLFRHIDARLLVFVVVHIDLNGPVCGIVTGPVETDSIQLAAFAEFHIAVIVAVKSLVVIGGIALAAFGPQVFRPDGETEFFAGSYLDRSVKGNIPALVSSGIGE